MALSVKRVISKLERPRAWLHKHFSIKNKDPHFTVFELRMKIVSVFIGGIAIDMLGQRIRSIEAQVVVTGGYLGPENFFYVYCLGAQGLAFGLVFWRLLEIYWWGKNRVAKHDNYA